MVKKLVFIIALCVISFTSMAQDMPSRQAVEIEAGDGLILKGDYYSSPEAGVAVLLLHMNNSNKEAWSPFIPALHEAGYGVLAVDTRGFGSTGGVRDFELAQTDVQAWLDWLKSQDGVTGVAIIGASVGANLALVGCANDADCLTVIALSPGENFFDVAPADAIQTGLADRSALFVASLRDTESAQAVRTFAQIATGIFGVRMYDRSQHGTAYFAGRGVEEKINTFISWLDEYAIVAE